MGKGIIVMKGGRGGRKKARSSFDHSFIVASLLTVMLHNDSFIRAFFFLLLTAFSLSLWVLLSRLIVVHASRGIYNLGPSHAVSSRWFFFSFPNDKWFTSRIISSILNEMAVMQFPNNFSISFVCIEKKSESFHRFIHSIFICKTEISSLNLRPLVWNFFNIDDWGIYSWNCIFRNFHLSISFDHFFCIF